MLTRRHFHRSALWAIAGLAGCQTPHASNRLNADLQALERQVNGRLGVQVVDWGTGREWGHRADERFMMLNSHKLLAAGLVLYRHDQGEDSLARRIRFTRADLVSHSPVTEHHVGGQGMSLAELCHATLTTSDNTAANLIHDSYGGPQGLTRFLRSLGDDVTRLDRHETALNVPHDGEPLDSTIPRAITRSMGQLVLGDVLRPASRQQLQDWLVANTTGGKRLRAGLPAGWRVGDKTGTAEVGANDIGVAWPPGRAPILLSVYLEAPPTAARDEAIATAARLAVAALA
jgi:beta-lactamase class A